MIAFSYRNRQLFLYFLILPVQRQVLNPWTREMPAKFTSCQVLPLKDTLWNAESMGPTNTEGKATATGILKEPGLLNKGPNLLLDLDMGILKLGPLEI